ncbi:UPF0097 protein [Gluconacetobacter sp. SXCC-1]|nr:UPF0097 protein [Gluconacetobacter sp. SXCC-1]
MPPGHITLYILYTCQSGICRFSLFTGRIIMRLFIGLELPPSISLALADLRGSLPDVAWTAPESWHLTLHFIGEVTQPHQLEEIHHALCAIHAAPPLLELAAPGLFETHGRPARDVLWIGCAPDPALLHLRSRVRAVMNRILPATVPNSRRFVPHVTLGHLHNPGPELRQRWLATALPASQPQTVGHFTLFRSIRHADGPFHEALEHYPLPS